MTEKKPPKPKKANLGPVFRVAYSSLIRVDPVSALCRDCRGRVHRTVADSHWCPATTTGYWFGEAWR